MAEQTVDPYPRCNPTPALTNDTSLPGVVDEKGLCINIDYEEFNMSRQPVSA